MHQGLRPRSDWRVVVTPPEHRAAGLLDQLLAVGAHPIAWVEARRMSIVLLGLNHRTAHRATAAALAPRTRWRGTSLVTPTALPFTT